jgi:hypothetical protein
MNFRKVSRITGQLTVEVFHCPYPKGQSELIAYFESFDHSGVAMFRRTHRQFELESFRAKEGGYVVRLSRKGSVVHVLGGDEKGRGSFEDPDIALDWAIDWVEQNFQKAWPRFRGRVS